MFSSGSLSSISLRHRHAVLGDDRGAELLSDDTLRPLGPRVTLTASASRFTPRSTAWRESFPYVICFAIVFLGLLFADDREDFVLAKDEVLLVVRS